MPLALAAQGAAEPVSATLLNAPSAEGRNRCEALMQDVVGDGGGGPGGLGLGGGGELGLGGGIKGGEGGAGGGVCWL